MECRHGRHARLASIPMTSVRQLKAMRGAGEPSSVAARCLDVAVAAVRLVETWNQNNPWEVMERAENKLEIAVHRYQRALKRAWENQR